MVLDVPSLFYLEPLRAELNRNILEVDSSIERSEPKFYPEIVLLQFFESEIEDS